MPCAASLRRSGRSRFFFSIATFPTWRTCSRPRWNRPTSIRRQSSVERAALSFQAHFSTSGFLKRLFVDLTWVA